jgi:hypothetical protein
MYSWFWDEVWLNPTTWDGNSSCGNIWCCAGFSPEPAFCRHWHSATLCRKHVIVTANCFNLTSSLGTAGIFPYQKTLTVFTA